VAAAACSSGLRILGISATSYEAYAAALQLLPAAMRARAAVDFIEDGVSGLRFSLQWWARQGDLLSLLGSSQVPTHGPTCKLAAGPASDGQRGAVAAQAAGATGAACSCREVKVKSHVDAIMSVFGVCMQAACMPVGPDSASSAPAPASAGDSGFGFAAAPSAQQQPAECVEPASLLLRQGDLPSLTGQLIAVLLDLKETQGAQGTVAAAALADWPDSDDDKTPGSSRSARRSAPGAQQSAPGLTAAGPQSLLAGRCLAGLLEAAMAATAIQEHAAATSHLGFGANAGLRAPPSLSLGSVPSARVMHEPAGGLTYAAAVQPEAEAPSATAQLLEALLPRTQAIACWVTQQHHAGEGEGEREAALPEHRLLILLLHATIALLRRFTPPEAQAAEDRSDPLFKWKRAAEAAAADGDAGNAGVAGLKRTDLRRSPAASAVWAQDQAPTANLLSPFRDGSARSRAEDPYALSSARLFGPPAALQAAAAALPAAAQSQHQQRQQRLAREALLRLAKGVLQAAARTAGACLGGLTDDAAILGLLLEAAELLQCNGEGVRLLPQPALLPRATSVSKGASALSGGEPGAVLYRLLRCLAYAHAEALLSQSPQSGGSSVSALERSPRDTDAEIPSQSPARAAADWLPSIGVLGHLALAQEVPLLLELADPFAYGVVMAGLHRSPAWVAPAARAAGAAGEGATPADDRLALQTRQVTAASLFAASEALQVLLAGWVQQPETPVDDDEASQTEPLPELPAAFVDALVQLARSTMPTLMELVWARRGAPQLGPAAASVQAAALRYCQLGKALLRCVWSQALPALLRDSTAALVLPLLFMWCSERTGAGPESPDASGPLAGSRRLPSLGSMVADVFSGPAATAGVVVESLESAASAEEGEDADASAARPAGSHRPCYDTWCMLATSTIDVGSAPQSPSLLAACLARLAGGLRQAVSGNAADVSPTPAEALQLALRMVSGLSASSTAPGAGAAAVPDASAGWQRSRSMALRLLYQRDTRHAFSAMLAAIAHLSVRVSRDAVDAGAGSNAASEGAPLLLAPAERLLHEALCLLFPAAQFEHQLAGAHALPALHSAAQAAEREAGRSSGLSALRMTLLQHAQRMSSSGGSGAAVGGVSARPDGAATGSLEESLQLHPARLCGAAHQEECGIPRSFFPSASMPPLDANGSVVTWTTTMARAVRAELGRALLEESSDAGAGVAQGSAGATEPAPDSPGADAVNVIAPVEPGDEPPVEGDALSPAAPAPKVVEEEGTTEDIAKKEVSSESAAGGATAAASRGALQLRECVATWLQRCASPESAVRQGAALMLAALAEADAARTVALVAEAAGEGVPEGARTSGAEVLAEVVHACQALELAGTSSASDGGGAPPASLILLGLLLRALGSSSGGGSRSAVTDALAGSAASAPSHALLLLQQSLRLADAPAAASNRLETALQSAEGICRHGAVRDGRSAGDAPAAPAQRVDARACAVLLAAASEQLRSLQSGHREHSSAGGCLACGLDLLLELLQHLALALAPASGCSERAELRLRLHGLGNRIMAAAATELVRDASSAGAAAAPVSTWEILLGRCLPLAASLCGAMALPTEAAAAAETERPVVQTAGTYGSGGAGAATTQSLRAMSAAPLSGPRSAAGASRLPVGLRLRSASSDSAGEGAASEGRAAALSYLSPLGTPGGIVVANAETLDGTPDGAAPTSFLAEGPVLMEEADATARRGTDGAASVLSSAACSSPATSADKLGATDSAAALVASHRALVAATRGLICDALRACLRAAIARLSMDATAPVAGGAVSVAPAAVAPAGAYSAHPLQQSIGAYAGAATAGGASAAAPPEVPAPVALPPPQQPAPAAAPMPHIRRPSVRAGLSLQERLRAALGGGVSNISAGASPAAGASTPLAFTPAAGAATPSQQQREARATPAASGAGAPSSPLLGPFAAGTSGGRGGYDGVRTLAPVPALAPAEVDGLLRIAVQSALLARAFVTDSPLPPSPATASSCSGASAGARARQLQALCGCDCCAANSSEEAGAPRCALLCLLDCLRLSLQLVGRAAAFTTTVLQQAGTASRALAGAVAAQGVGVWLAQLLLHSLAPRLLGPGVQRAHGSDDVCGAAGSACGCMQRCGQDLQRLLGRVSAGEYRLHTLAGADAAAATRLRMLEALLQSTALGCCLSLV
jgi:hypothetical protein